MGIVWVHCRRVRASEGKLIGTPHISVDEAEARIRSLVWETPTIPWLEQGTRERSGAAPPVYLKLENMQRSGSFKIRGAFNSLLRLSEARRAAGLVTCSSGNHGRAVATAAGILDVRAEIFVPDWVDDVKLAGIREAGATVRVGGATFDEAEARALAAAKEQGLTYLSAFDDPGVIEGQGTIAAEILRQVPDVAEVIVPLSGGGLASGVAHAMSAAGRKTTAASAIRANVMAESIRHGHPIVKEEETTVASALAGGIGPDNRYTFRMVRDLVDHHLAVSEDQIRSAMKYAYESLKLVVEGGGAVGLAALLSGYRPTGPCVVVLSGGNVNPSLLDSVVND